MTGESKRIERLRSRLSEKAAGCQLVYEHETGSTNDLALLAAENGMTAPCVFLADVQRNGRGRFNRVWESKEGASLTFSLLMKPDCRITSFPMLTEVVGLAVCKVLREQYQIPSRIKWPNDVVIVGKKVCGILTVTTHDLKQVIIGVGINVRKTEWPKELADKAVSMEEASGKCPDPDELLCEIIEKFLELFESFRTAGDMRNLKEEYASLLINIGKRSCIVEKGISHPGTALGIDEKGRLLFQQENGEVKTVESGEVSVSGIYGEIM